MPSPSHSGQTSGASFQGVFLALLTCHVRRLLDLHHGRLVDDLPNPPADLCYGGTQARVVVLGQQLEFLANTVRMYRGEEPELTRGSEEMMRGSFPDLAYADVSGLCRVTTIKDIEEQGWSLNPGRYVGVADRTTEDFDFTERLEELNEELEVLNAAMARRVRNAI